MDSNPGEAAKYGIMFDDTEYDYTQHLKEIGTDVNGVFISAPTASGSNAKRKGKDTIEFRTGRGTIELPRDAFASEFEQDVGLLNLAAPVSGPQPELGSEVRETLEALEDEAYTGELDDDLLAQLDASDIGSVPDDEADDVGISDNEWAHVYKTKTGQAMSHDHETQSIDSFGERSVGPEEIEERKTSRLTQYSMTSSILPRTEDLQLLDSRFEKLIEQYDTTDIGELDSNDPNVHGLRRLETMDDVLDEFLQSEGTKTGLMGVVDSSERLLIKAGLLKPTPAALKRIEKESERAQRMIIGDSDDRPTLEEQERERVATEERLEANWDCETILTTYSNLENHPIMIKDSQRRKRIQVDRRGFPTVKDTTPEGATLSTVEIVASMVARQEQGDKDEEIINDVDGSSDEGDETKTETTTTSKVPNLRRSQNETPQEKRQRKQAVKEHRRARRTEKKATKQLFTTERLRQERERQNGHIGGVHHL